MYLNLEQVLRPTTLRECVAALAADQTLPLAGGTRLSAIEQEHVRCLVDLQLLPLGGITTAEDHVRIGAMVSLTELVEACLPKPLSALAQAALAERNLPVRNQSTVGGRLGRRRADARIATALLALGARVEVATLSGDDVSLTVSDLGAWLAGAGGLLTAVLVPTNTASSAYRCFSLTAVDAPVADAAVASLVDGGWRMASGGHGAAGAGVVLLKGAAETKQQDGEDDDAWLARVQAAALADLPEYTDARAGGGYRKAVGATLVRRLTAELRIAGDK